MRSLFRRSIPGCAFLLAASVLASGHAQQWGDLTGRLIYTGDPPTRKPIVITNDKQYCGKCNLLEEDLVVDPETSGVANAVVWLYIARHQPLPQVHPSYATTEKATVTIDSEKCRVKPHVTLLRTTQTLLIRNTDPIGDGLKIDTTSNSPVNLLLGPHAEIPHHFANPERQPARVGCPVHTWESGWLLVLDHPYMDVSDPRGRFEIKNIPAGEWTFQFWHERPRHLDRVHLSGRRTNWRRGRVKIDIRPGSNDLGPIELAPEDL